MKPTTRKLIANAQAHRNHPDRHAVARILRRLKDLNIVPACYLVKAQAVVLGLCFGMQFAGIVSLCGCAGARVETVVQCEARPIDTEWERCPTDWECEVEARASWEQVY